MATRRRSPAPESDSLARIKLSRLEARLKRRLAPLLKVPARAEEPYASHVPVLVGLAGLLRPRRVLELGAGLYSTSTFLDRRLFPSLECLRSVENDVQWLDRVREDLPGDTRLELLLADGPVGQVVESVDIAPFDLVFIDDSVVAADRVTTIRAVARRLPQTAVAVIHDFEVQPYREAAFRFDHRLTFDVHNPFTGVCWNGDGARRSDLRRLLRELKGLRNSIPMTDGGAWNDALIARSPRED